MAGLRITACGTGGTGVTAGIGDDAAGASISVRIRSGVRGVTVPVFGVGALITVGVCDGAGMAGTATAAAIGAVNVAANAGTVASALRKSSAV